MPFDLDTAPPIPEPTKLERLAAVARKLGDDEQSVLLLIAERLAMGVRTYGPLHVDTDPRCWIQESTEESADLSIYLTAQLIRQRRARNDADERTRRMCGATRGR